MNEPGAGGWEDEEREDWELEEEGDPRDLTFDSAAHFYNSLVSMPKLTIEEERELVSRKMNGDTEARDELVHRLLRAVLFLARRHGEKWGIHDAFQVGAAALARCVERYDPFHGARVLTYAWPRIRGAMLNEGYKGVRQTTGMSAQKQQELARLRRRAAELEAVWAHTPSAAELAEATGCSEDRQAMLWEGYLRPYSLDDCATLDDEKDTGARHELIADKAMPSAEDEVVRAERLAELEKAMECLTEKQRMVLTMKYGLGGNEPMRVVEIAEALGVSHSFPYRMIDRALERVRRQIEVLD